MKIAKWIAVIFISATIFFFGLTATGAGCSGAAMSDSCGMSNHKHDLNSKKNAHPSESTQNHQFLASMLIYMDSPMAIYARAQEIGLSEEQKARLIVINDESRKAALASLNNEQRQKLGTIPNEPVTLSQISQASDSQSLNERPQADSAQQSGKTNAGEQKTCPVLGGAINKDLFTVYKGKNVYFCCPGCEEKFVKEPDKYLPKLPQFAK